MKKVVLFVVGICIASFICYNFFLYVILPTESVKHTLTLVPNGDIFMNNIIIKHYIDDRHIKSYVLDLVIEPRHQVPQKYELPQLKDGSVIIDLECKYDISFTLEYKNAYDFYKNGLLIYTITDLKKYVEADGCVSHDRYIYFKSGKNKTVFLQKAGRDTWSIDDDPPRLKKFNKKEWGYSPIYDGWKENQWKEISVG